MGAKHITAQEKELFQVLVNTGLSMQKVATLTGRDAGTVSNHVTSTVSNNLTASRTNPVEHIHLTQDEMFSMLDLHAQGMTCTQIGKEVGKAHGTVYKVINQLYPKHKKAHAKWLELQGQKDIPVDPVVTPALQPIRDAREAGCSMTDQEEESPALVMKVQTVETDSVKPSCNHQVIIHTQREIIEKQKVIIANQEETIIFLKEHIQLLKSLR